MSVKRLSLAVDPKMFNERVQGGFGTPGNRHVRIVVGVARIGCRVTATILRRRRSIWTRQRPTVTTESSRMSE